MPIPWPRYSQFEFETSIESIGGLSWKAVLSQSQETIWDQNFFPGGIPEISTIYAANVHSRREHDESDDSQSPACIEHENKDHCSLGDWSCKNIYVQANLIWNCGCICSQSACDTTCKQMPDICESSPQDLLKGGCGEIWLLKSLRKLITPMKDIMKKIFGSLPY